MEIRAQKKTQTRIKHLNKRKACLAGDVLGNLWDGKRDVVGQLLCEVLWGVECSRVKGREGKQKLAFRN